MHVELDYRSPEEIRDNVGLLINKIRTFDDIHPHKKRPFDKICNDYACDMIPNLEMYKAEKYLSEIEPYEPIGANELPF